MSPALTTGLVLAVTAALLAMIAWSVQRIIVRIDAIGAKLEGLATRVTVIETKQDTTTELAARADRVGRATAAKVGARLPKDLTDTLDPSRLRRTS
jgi:hypothetical protein